MSEETTPPAGPEAPAAAPERRPFEAWAKSKKTPRWVLAAAKAGERWPAGRELTETQFDAALQRARTGAHR
jgi:hypothetical protein